LATGGLEALEGGRGPEIKDFLPLQSAIARILSRQRGAEKEDASYEIGPLRALGKDRGRKKPARAARNVKEDWNSNIMIWTPALYSPLREEGEKREKLDRES